MPMWVDKGIDEEGFRVLELGGGGKFQVTISARGGDQPGTYVAMAERVSAWADDRAIDHAKRVAEEALIKLQAEKR